jgi:hypothetical protein
MTTKIRWAAFAVLVLASVTYALWPMAKGLTRPAPPVAQENIRPSKVPALRITPPAVDFGTLPVGKTCTLAVQVENLSSQAITVYRVSGSCECISGEIREHNIPPGRSVSAELRFTGLPGRGSYSGSAVLVTDEAGPSKYEIGVRGIVEEDLSLEPKILQFGSLSKNATTFREARLRHREGRPFSIKSIDGARGGCEVTFSPAEAGGGGGYTIRALVRALRPGTFTHEFVIRTDCKSMPELRLTLAGEVESDYRCVPAIAALKPSTEGGVASCEVVIEKSKAEPFRIRSVRESRNLPIQFSVAEVDPERRKVTIQLTEPPGEGVQLGEFLILIDAEDEPLHVPYRLDALARKAEGKP